MSKANPILKIDVVCGSVLLGGSFVAYKAGAFQQPAAESNAAVIDSPQVKTDSAVINTFFLDEHMSSSKSAGVVFDEKDMQQQIKAADTSKKKKTAVKTKNNQANTAAYPNANQSTSQNKKDTNKAKPIQIMPSSKSAPIFDRKK